MALAKVHFKSNVLGLHLSMNVLLPERDCPCRDGKWPTLYLLHGLSDDHSAWLRQTSIERYVQDMDIAVVMPEVHRSFYTDMRHGGRYYTFISEELPALCERLFPLSTERAGRFAAGLSMGGYGAFKLGLTLPERYAAVASLSGAIDLLTLNPHSDEIRALMEDVFGPIDQIRGGENDLFAAASRLIDSGKPLPRFFMACGTEDFLYENNLAFFKQFEKPLCIAYREGAGKHDWAFWDAYIQDVLAWLPVAGSGAS